MTPFPPPNKQANRRPSFCTLYFTFFIFHFPALQLKPMHIVPLPQPRKPHDVHQERDAQRKDEADDEAVEEGQRAAVEDDAPKPEDDELDQVGDEDGKGVEAQEPVELEDDPDGVQRPPGQARAEHAENGGQGDSGGPYGRLLGIGHGADRFGHDGRRAVVGRLRPAHKGPGAEAGAALLVADGEGVDKGDAYAHGKGYQDRAQQPGRARGAVGHAEGVGQRRRGAPPANQAGVDDAVGHQGGVGHARRPQEDFGHAGAPPWEHVGEPAGGQVFHHGKEAGPHK